MKSPPPVTHTTTEIAHVHCLHGGCEHAGLLYNKFKSKLLVDDSTNMYGRLEPISVSAAELMMLVRILQGTIYHIVRECSIGHVGGGGISNAAVRSGEEILRFDCGVWHI